MRFFWPQGGCAAHTNVDEDETARLHGVCSVTYGMCLQRGFSGCVDFSDGFQSHGTMWNQHFFHVFLTQEFALVCHGWSVLLEVCFIDLVPLSLPPCPHWWNHNLRTDSICFENRNFYTDRKSNMSNLESRIALQAKNVCTVRTQYSWCRDTNIKTVWARSCQVRLSTPLFQQTWQAP